MHEEPTLPTESPIPRTPAAEEVDAHLEKIVRSEGFANSERLQRFLRFAVGAKLRGDTGAVKEYLLGREVFDRNESYDPRIDPIVRVEARRLRQRLDAFYSGEGKAEKWQIQFPKGTYLPEFVWCLPPGLGEETALGEDAALGEKPVSATVGMVDTAKSKGRWWVFGLVGLACLLALLAMRNGGLAQPQAQTHLEPLTVVIPAGWIWREPAADALAEERLAEEIGAAVANANLRKVIAWPMVVNFRGAGKTLQEVASARKASYVLVVELERQGPSGFLAVLFLINSTQGSKVWVGQYKMATVDEAARNQVVRAALADMRRLP